MNTDSPIPVAPVVTPVQIVRSKSSSYPGDFCVKIKQQKIYFPSDVFAAFRCLGLTTLETIASYTMDRPAVIARSLGWTRDEAALAAEMLLDDLETVLSSEDRMRLRRRFVHREKIRKLALRGGAKVNEASRPADSTEI